MRLKKIIVLLLLAATACAFFYNETYADTSVVRLNTALTDQVYDLVKDVKVETTKSTARYLAESFPGEKWAKRQPRVLKGTSVTGDNFWKGGVRSQECAPDNEDL